MKSIIIKTNSEKISYLKKNIIFKKIILFLTLLAYKKATTDTAIKNGDDISDVDEVNDVFSTNDEDDFQIMINLENQKKKQEVMENPAYKNDVIETKVINDNTEYLVVLKNYQIIEKDATTGNILNQKNYTFTEIYDRFKGEDDMVERNLALTYSKERGYINDSNVHALGFGLKTQEGFKFSFLQNKVTPEIFNKKLEISIPTIKIFNNGIELSSASLNTNDLLNICEEGISNIPDTYLQGGEPMPAKEPEAEVEQVEEQDDRSECFNPFEDDEDDYMYIETPNEEQEDRDKKVMENPIYENNTIETTVTQNNKEIQLVLKNYEIIERDLTTLKIIDKQLISFSYTYGKFNGKQEMIERMLVISYCNDKNYIKSEHGLGFAKKVEHGFYYTFVKSQVTADVFNKRIEITTPCLKIYNEGVELKQVDIQSTDLMNICVDGLSNISEGYLEDVEELVKLKVKPKKKVEEPKPVKIDSDESSDDEEDDLIALNPQLDNQNFKNHIWEEEISYKFQEYKIKIVNYEVKYMIKTPSDKHFKEDVSKKWTFEEFYTQFHRMQNDSEREMAKVILLKEVAKEKNKSYVFDKDEILTGMQQLSYGKFTTKNATKYIILDSKSTDEEEDESIGEDLRDYILVSYPLLEVTHKGNKLASFYLSAQDIVYLCENGSFGFVIQVIDNHVQQQGGK